MGLSSSIIAADYFLNMKRFAACERVETGLILMLSFNLFILFKRVVWCIICPFHHAIFILLKRVWLP